MRKSQNSVREALKDFAKLHGTAAAENFARKHGGDGPTMLVPAERCDGAASELSNLFGIVVSGDTDETPEVVTELDFDAIWAHWNRIKNP